MNNKDRMALSRFAAAFEEYAKEDKSRAAKELRSEREAWEKSAGGAKKLDDAEAAARAIVAGAEATAQKIKADVFEMVKAFDTSSDTRKAALAEREIAVRDAEVAVAGSRVVLVEQQQVIEKANRQVQARETGVADVGAALANREADIDAREASVVAREAEVDRKFAALRTALG